MKRANNIDFLEKGATINSTSYYQLLRQNSSYSLNGPCMDEGFSKSSKTHQERKA